MLQQDVNVNTQLDTVEEKAEDSVQLSTGWTNTVILLTLNRILDPVKETTHFAGLSLS